jgi:hypothetical protein
MPKKETTRSFIVELPLRTTGRDDRALLINLDCGRQLYSACLGKALRRLDLMRDAKTYSKGRALRKIEDRTEAFKSLREGLRVKNVPSSRGLNQC